MTRTCHPASAILPPELAPIRVGLALSLSVFSHLKKGERQALPEADSNVSSIHSILSIVLLNLIEMLYIMISDTLEITRMGLKRYQYKRSQSSIVSVW